MRIVFHGATAQNFRAGVEGLLERSHDVASVTDALCTKDDIAAYSRADVIVSTRLSAKMPALSTLRLFQVPGAGHDNVDQSLLPAGAAFCNCYGHERAIAEYVMATLLMRRIPIADADHQLRQGQWRFGAAGSDARLHGELGEISLGILGYGHIGQAVAALAMRFGMKVTVANRTGIDIPPGVERIYSLDALHAFMGSADAIVTTLPLTETTHGLIDSAALAAMRCNGIIINVGRGPVIDETALFEALANRSIGGAILDTWYVYPTAKDRQVMPAHLPFHQLDNVTMTPHMSGWTTGTIRRRHETIADNINRLATGRALRNLIKL